MKLDVLNLCIFPDGWADKENGRDSWILECLHVDSKGLLKHSKTEKERRTKYTSE